MAKKKAQETNKPNPETNKKKNLISKKKKKKPNKTLALISPDSDTDSDTNLSSLETLPKPQLISLLAAAAAADPSLAARISAAADADVAHRKIFVHGLGWDAARDTLVAAFGGFGKIEDCNVILDRVSGKSKGYGFVVFETRKAAIKALKEPVKRIGNRVASCQLSSVGNVGAAAAVAAPTAASQQDATGRKIYISNVPTDADPEKLRTFFAKFGEIETGPLGFDTHTGKSRGFALFVYKTAESAKLAIQDQVKLFEGHQLRCSKAIEHKNKAAAGGAATITTAVQPMQPPVLAAMAAAQNMAMMSQQYQQFPGFNPLYNGLFANPMISAQLGGFGPTGPGQVSGFGLTGPSQVSGFGPTGPGQVSGFGLTGPSQVSGFGPTGPGQVSGFGPTGPSQLSGYGPTGPSQVNKLGGGLGLQNAYLGASARPLGDAGASFSGLTNPVFKR